MTAVLDSSSKPAPSDPPRRRRDPYLDNAKMVLVTLVVVGHAWTLLPANAVQQHAYDWLYLWHMPAFVMVTAYLSRRFRWSRTSLRRLVTQVAVPYVVFEGALVLFRRSITGADYDAVFLEPHWPMWFLAALFLWRLATPVLRRVPFLLPLAVVVCLLGGLVSLPVLDTGRVLGFLPFWAAGLLVEDRHLAWLRRTTVRRVAPLVLLAGVGLTFAVEPLGTTWLYWRDDYATLDAGPLEGMAIRLGLLAACFAMALAGLALIPRRRLAITAMGAASLVVYLFHGFFVKGAEYAGVPDWTAAHPALGAVVVTAAAVGVALLLAVPPISRRLTPVVDPVETTAAAVANARNDI